MKTVDCFWAKVWGDRVVCDKGWKIGRGEDGSLALRVVEKGISSGKCKTCEETQPDFYEELKDD